MLEFFSWKKFEYGKNLCVSLNPYPKEPPKHPLYGAESKIFSGLLHLEHTFRTYILFTFRTHIRITFINYIYRLLFKCPPTIQTPTPTPTTRSPNLLTFINYIYNYIYNLLAPSIASFPFLSYSISTIH